MYNRGRETENPAAAPVLLAPFPLRGLPCVVRGGRLAGTRAAVTYLKLFDLALQRQEHLGITQLTYKEIARRTGLSSRTVRRTLKAMKD